ncbi:MAG: rRNA adenine methyltransferase [Actinomycetia bacterium]|nr:rRNA adenine methyltransferase [Actinomycetes bacterium]
MINEVISRITIGTEKRRSQFQKGFKSFSKLHGLKGWEGWFSPYDDEIYKKVLKNIKKEDVVLDIGAGDLRLSLQIAMRVKMVYAIEVNPKVLGSALKIIGFDLPRNLVAICANAMDISFPKEITIAVLLMRHCQHFMDYVIKLRSTNCKNLITNIRWKTGVESINLTVNGENFSQFKNGWYACKCGAIGFFSYDNNIIEQNFPIHEVENCPHCGI